MVGVVHEGLAMNGQDLDKLLRDLEAAAEFKRTNRKNFFEPYAKQHAFLAMGATKRERLLMAGNQLGKSETGAFETATHLRGDYPDWWTGRVFTHPVKWWAAGETSLLVRDVSQKKLCGEPGVTNDFGTGFIPKAAFVDTPTLARGVTDAYDTIQIEHVVREVKKGTYIKTPIADGVSICRFKSYEQGRQKFQGETLHGFWADEEPELDIYSELLTRITATKGLGFLTFTPLKGMSEVVMRYLNEPSDDRGVVTMTIEDALHIDPAERATIIAGYPAHEREARSKGIPMLGSGRIFQYAEAAITEETIPFERIPLHWKKVWGFDFGIGHPFAAVLIAWDVDNDVIHVLHAIRVSDQLPLQHSAAVKSVAVDVPVAWPQDGTERRDDGKPLSDHYKRNGLRMHHEHATHADGSVSTEAGILEMQQRMETGRFKVAAHLSDWWQEFRMYHRKDGKIVKLNDDLMSATRVAVMMKRIAAAGPLGSKSNRNRRKALVADDVDFDLA